MTPYLLLGLRNTDLHTNSTVYVTEKRINTSVVLSGGGPWGDALSVSSRQQVSFYGRDFSNTTRPALIVYDDEDESPQDMELVALRRGNHSLGGVSGWDTAEAAAGNDDNPERLVTVQRMTWAYLKSSLYENDSSWDDAAKAFQGIARLGTAEDTVMAWTHSTSAYVHAPAARASRDADESGLIV
ncbi:hypothetical protein DV736_g3803, partial [Chaetothyriales sp. CBS 134916]